MTQKKIHLPYFMENTNYSETTTTHHFELDGKKESTTITTKNGEKYLTPKKSLIDFLNKKLSNWGETENQKYAIEEFFKERYFGLKRIKKSNMYEGWKIFKLLDGSFLSVYWYTTGIMEDMTPNNKIHLIKVNGDIEELNRIPREEEHVEFIEIYNTD